MRTQGSPCFLPMQTLTQMRSELLMFHCRYGVNRSCLFRHEGQRAAAVSRRIFFFFVAGGRCRKVLIQQQESFTLTLYIWCRRSVDLKRSSRHRVLSANGIVQITFPCGLFKFVTYVFVEGYAHVCEVAFRLETSCSGVGSLARLKDHRGTFRRCHQVVFTNV